MGKKIKVFLIISGVLIAFFFVIYFLPENTNQDNQGDEFNSNKIILPTFWELSELPFAYHYLGFSSCVDFPLKDKITSTACVTTDIDTTYHYEWRGDLKNLTTCEEICLDRNYLAKLPFDESIKVLIYYDFNDYGGNPKVLQTEIIR